MPLHSNSNCLSPRTFFGLTSGTEVRRPSTYLFPNHLSFTPWTWLPVLLEDPQVVLMLAWPVQHVLVEPHRRPPMLDAGREIRQYCRMQRLPFAFGERVRLPSRMQPCIVQDFIGVDISYA